MNQTQKRKSSAREIAGKVVHDVMSTDLYSNRRLSELLETSDLETRDRNFCAELVYGTLRFAMPLEDSLRSALNKPGKIPPRVLAHCLVAAYQLQHLSDTIPAHAAVNEAVALVKKLAPGLSGLTNAILRKLGSPKDQMIVFKKASPVELSRAFGLPFDLVHCIQEKIPAAEWEASMRSFNERPKLYFRSHDLVNSSEEILLHPFVPQCFEKASADLSQKLSDGSSVVQDPASQIAALLLAPAPSARVIDMCAAPGMKSLILKKLVGSFGTVLAVDNNPARKARLVENMNRLKLPFEIRIEDARKLSSDKTLEGSFDSVLLDAPCSGLGTIRRHPEIKHRYSAEKLEEIIKLQRELLSCAARLLKPGGVLVYSVCSPIDSEGSAQIEWFLAQHPEMKTDDPTHVLPWLPKSAVTPQNFVTLWPHLHQSDAFFAARLIKA